MSSLNLTTWAIVAAPDAYLVRELALGDIGGRDVVAVHPDRRSAELGVERMEMMRRQIEGQLRASLDHEAAMRNRMARAVLEIGKPRAAEP